MEGDLAQGAEAAGDARPRSGGHGIGQATGEDDPPRLDGQATLGEDIRGQGQGLGGMAQDCCARGRCDDLTVDDQLDRLGDQVELLGLPRRSGDPVGTRRRVVGDYVGGGELEVAVAAVDDFAAWAVAASTPGPTSRSLITNTISGSMRG